MFNESIEEENLQQQINEMKNTVSHLESQMMKILAEKDKKG